MRNKAKIAWVVWLILMFVYNVGIKNVEEFSLQWNVFWFCSIYGILIFVLFKEMLQSTTWKEAFFFFVVMLYPIIGFATNLTGLTGDYQLYESFVINEYVDIGLGVLIAGSLILLSKSK